LLPDVKEGGGWRASGDEVLRVSSRELVWLQNKARKGSGRCVSARERKRDQYRAEVLYAGDGIVLERPQHCGSPVRNRSGLAASSAEREGRGERGEGRLYRGGIGGHSRRR
jgi:hypothetical protein